MLRASRERVAAHPRRKRLLTVTSSTNTTNDYGRYPSPQARRRVVQLVRPRESGSRLFHSPVFTHPLKEANMLNGRAGTIEAQICDPDTVS